MPRYRYNRASLTSTISAAAKMATNNQQPAYVWATAYGYTIGYEAPPFQQHHYVITPLADPVYVNPAERISP